MVNLSSRHLEDPHLSALSKGLNFAPAPGSIPKAHLVASVEAAIGRAKASDSEAAKARMNVIGAISRTRLPPRNLMPKEAPALKDLAKDDSILVLPADKGKATVVMDRADYDAKMELMLNDESAYQPLKKDPTTSLEKKMNARLLQLSQMDRLPSDVYSKLKKFSRQDPITLWTPQSAQTRRPP